MNRFFSDTWFFLALLNRADTGHQRAMSMHLAELRHRISTDWIMVEVGDALSRSGDRKSFLAFHDSIMRAPGYTIIPASREVLEAGLTLFRRRLDKNWSLTDCISFAIVADERITDALTGDKHFTQAGFQALLA